MQRTAAYNMPELADIDGKDGEFYVAPPALVRKLEVGLARPKFVKYETPDERYKTLISLGLSEKSIKVLKRFERKDIARKAKRVLEVDAPELPGGRGMRVRRFDFTANRELLQQYFSAPLQSNG
jgi:hypothetical protein